MKEIYDDVWKGNHRYKRQLSKRETTEIINDLYIDVIWLPAYNMGDISSLYCDMGPPFWQVPPDKFLRETGDID